MKFSDIKKEVKEDLTLPKDLSRLESKIREIPKLHSKYLNLFFREKAKLLKKEKDLKKLYKEKYYFYKNDYEYKLKDNQIDWHIESDDRYSDKKFEYDTQKIVVEYFYKVIQKINTMSYDIKNLIEWKSFLNGVKG